MSRQSQGGIRSNFWTRVILLLVAYDTRLIFSSVYVNALLAMERMLHPYGDRELHYAEAEDKSWRLPLYVDWRVDKTVDVHYAHVLPAFCPYHSQGLTLIAMLQPHDILGRTDQWVIPRRIAEAILHKAPGITPKYYYHWPEINGPPQMAPLQVLRAEVKQTQPKPPPDESFAQYVARSRKLSTSIINVVMNAIAEEATTWMVQHRRPLDLGFCKLVAVPFRANWKEIVAFKARDRGVKLRAIMKLPKGQRTKALLDAGLPELLTSPHNIGLRRGWKVASGDSLCLDYCIEAVPTAKFNGTTTNIEARRQSQGGTGYVAHYEESVEQLYNYLVEALVSFVRKVATPFAQVCEGSRSGHLRFLPISGRKIRVRDKTLCSLPAHIMPNDSRFCVFGNESDPRIVRPKTPALPALPDLPQATVDMRERTVDGDFQLTEGEGAARMLLRHDTKIGATGEPMLPGPESAGARVDGAGDIGDPVI